MSGPIVRTGATPEFWKNWDNVFGKKSKKTAAPPATAQPVAVGKKTASAKKPAVSGAKKVTPAKGSKGKK